MNINNNTQKAESAISLLKDGISNNNKKKILSAYDNLSMDTEFNWDNLDVLFMEWNDLVDKANIILLE